jgi:hypothetical protein
VPLVGILGDLPPTDPDGFLAFARSLRFCDSYQAIRDGEPLDDPVGFRFPASVRHRYAYLGRLHAAAAHDARLAAAFLRVAGLVAPPESLLRPGVVLSVARGSLRPAGTRRGDRHPDAVRAAQP